MKECCACSESVPVKQRVCSCGYDFSQPSNVNDSITHIEKRKIQSRKSMASLRASESPECAKKRLKQSKTSMASLRASESSGCAKKRLDQSNISMASLRASESPECAKKRLDQSKISMASLRASESHECAKKRLKQSKTSMASLHASESPECAKKRLDQSNLSMASLRASESPECAKKCLDQSKISMASLRASESPECAKKRLDQSKISMASLRTKTVSVENAMLRFHVQINEGPDYVCTVCHRMMYKLSVGAYNRANYSKCSHDVIESVQLLEYVSSDGNQWVCKTCDKVLRNGKLPAQAKLEIVCLNALEVRLVCLRVPFMKMVALPVGKQRCIHGPAVNVPSKLNAICNLLPRLPSQTELIPVKFKRKLHFKGHYLYDYVCPQRVMRALTWLKSNPLYSDVLFNFEWEVASKDDSDLFTGLTGDSSNAEANINSKKSVVVTDYDLHYNIMVDLANDNNYTIIDVPGRPGDCLFNCVAHQLPSDFSEHVDGTALRAMTVEYLYRNPCINSINRVCFVSDDALGIPNGVTVTDEEKWQLYLHSLAADLWADHVAIQAVADVLNVAISILSSITKDTVVVSPLDQSLTPQCTLNVGLIHEHHYVAFDTCSSVSSYNQTDKLCNDGTCETISDKTFEEGDQHSRLITGGSQTCTFLSSDEPECQTHSILRGPASHEYYKGRAV